MSVDPVLHALPRVWNEVKLRWLNAHPGQEAPHRSVCVKWLLEREAKLGQVEDTLMIGAMGERAAAYAKLSGLVVAAHWKLHPTDAYYEPGATIELLVCEVERLRSVNVQQREDFDQLLANPPVCHHCGKPEINCDCAKESA